MVRAMSQMVRNRWLRFSPLIFRKKTTHCSVPQRSSLTPSMSPSSSPPTILIRLPRHPSPSSSSASGASNTGKSWSFLKFGAFESLTGATGTAAYATYDEVDEKTSAFQALSNHTIADDVSALEDLAKLNRDPARVLYISGHALDSCL